MGLLNNVFKKQKTEELKKEIDYAKIPSHIAIIMDGNGRWAKKKNLPRSAGHKAGADNLDRMTRYCRDIGIKYLTVYAFSTENWNRPSDEVKTLMDMFLQYLTKFERQYKPADRIILRIVGDRSVLNKEINQKIDSIEKMMQGKEGMVLNLAINYGGRAEIINVVKKAIENNEKPENITIETINKYLYTYPSPDPDLIIRTSGELRLSNFLIWQSAYSEYSFPNVLWPDFGEKDLLEAICEYQHRDRRFGKVK